MDGLEFTGDNRLRIGLVIMHVYNMNTCQLPWKSSRETQAMVVSVQIKGWQCVADSSIHSVLQTYTTTAQGC